MNEIQKRAISFNIKSSIFGLLCTIANLIFEKKGMIQLQHWASISSKMAFVVGASILLCALILYYVDVIKNKIRYFRR